MIKPLEFADLKPCDFISMKYNCYLWLPRTVECQTFNSEDFSQLLL